MEKHYWKYKVEIHISWSDRVAAEPTQYGCASSQARSYAGFGKTRGRLQVIGGTRAVPPSTVWRMMLGLQY